MARKRESAESFFSRLTRVFKNAPNVRRKQRSVDTSVVMPDKMSSGTLLFQRSISPTYSALTANAYNMAERLSRYQDFESMEQQAECAAALNLYADECVATSDTGRALTVYSDNPKIKSILEDLFYGRLNFEFNARPWIRSNLKFGDLFLYNDVSPVEGVINAFPIPVNEVEREENYDKDDPMAVRFRWTTLGNRILENWEVSHFRYLGNDMFLPYGTSIFDPARRVWRQLVLIEDAMLVYRIVRASDRRVFYIDVGNIPPADIPTYIEQQRKNLRASTVVDASTGRADLRYSPISIEDDFLIPVRGGETTTRVEPLPAGQNTANVEDVAYIQKKLIAALQVPRAWLSFDEGLSSRASLAQLDVRFARTISAIQKMFISELNKIAMIHLFALGYAGDDLTNFTLRLTNPSTVAQQQKLELWRAKFEIAGSVPENMGSREFIWKEIWNLSDPQIKAIMEQQLEDAARIGQLQAGGIGGEGGGGGGFGPAGGAGAGEGGLGGEEGGLGGGGLGGETAPAGETGGGGESETPPEENAEDEPIEDEDDELLITGSTDPEADAVSLRSMGAGPGRKQKLPVTAKDNVRHAKRNASRRRHFDNDFGISVSDGSRDDITGAKWIKSTVTNPFGEGYDPLTNDPISPKTPMSVATESAIRRFATRHNLPLNDPNEVDLIIEDDEDDDDIVING